MAGLFGIKRSQARIGTDAVELALDLTPEAITLHERAASGGWKKFATAALDDSEFPIVIGLLRTEAESRTGGHRPVRLWLPGEQVLQRRARIEGQDETERLREGFAFVARETVFRPDDVAIAVAPHDRNGDTTILITFAETWREARDYATRWGFLPGEVSTRHRAGDFGAEGPVFRLHEQTPAPPASAPRRGLAAAGAGIAATAAAALVWAFWPIGTPPEPAAPPAAVEELAATAPETADQPAAAAAEAAPETAPVDRAKPADPPPGPEPAVTAAMRADPAEAAFRPPGPGNPGEPPADPGPGLAPVRTAPWATLPDAPLAVAVAPRPIPAPEPDPAAGELPVPPMTPPAVLATPGAFPAPEILGTAALSDPAAWSPPGTLAPDPGALAGPVRAPVAEPEALAAALPVPLPPPRPRPGAASKQPEPETAPPAALSLPDALPGPEVPGTAALSDPVAWSPPGVLAPDRGALTGPVRALVATPEPAPAEPAAGPGAVTTAALPVPLPPPRPGPGAAEAPRSDLVLPPPRPSRLTRAVPPAAPVSEAETTETQEPGAEPPAIVAAPEPQPEPAETAVTEPPPPRAAAAEPARPTDAPPAAVNEDAPTALAVAVSPRPPARPARPLIRPELPAASLLPRLGGSAPGAVRAAATEQGLPLDKTALIGILNLDGNRKALLRLPDGRYRSVIVGDVLDGWRVSAIGVDAMRVTRSGEDRTLLLVNR